MTHEQWADAVPAPRRPAPRVARLSYPQPGVTLCTVDGDVDMITRPALASTLVEAARDANPHLVIDLSAVAFFGSTGLHALVETLDQVGRSGHVALVVDPKAPVAVPLRSTAMDRLFDVHRELASALRACRRPLPPEPRPPEPLPA